MHNYNYRSLDDSTNEDEESEIENRFGWLLILEMLVFIIHVYLCYKNSFKYQKRYKERKTEGSLFKLQFNQMIAYGSLVRAISLFLMILIHSPSENNAILLLEYLFITLPCLFWLPSYFAIILFFVRINYLITGEKNNIVQSVLKGILVCSGILYGWFLLRALTRTSYLTFVYDVSWLTGFLYLILAAGIFIFGQKILWSMQQNNDEEANRKIAESLKSVQILTYLCSMVFFIRGLFNILTITEVEMSRKYLVETLHVWHGILFLISELVPAVALSYLTKEKQSAEGTEKKNFELEALLKQDSREKALLANI